MWNPISVLCAPLCQGWQLSRVPVRAGGGAGHRKGPTSLPENNVFKASHCRSWEARAEARAETGVSCPSLLLTSAPAAQGPQRGLGPELASWVRSSGSHPGPRAHKGPVLGSTLCCHRGDILDTLGIWGSASLLCIPCCLQITWLVLPQKAGQLSHCPDGGMLGRPVAEGKGLPWAEHFACARLCVGGRRDHSDGEKDALAENETLRGQTQSSPCRWASFPHWVGGSLV